MKIYNRENLFWGLIFLSMAIAKFYDVINEGYFDIIVIALVIAVIFFFTRAFRKKNAVDYSTWSVRRKKWDAISKAFQVLTALCILLNAFTKIEILLVVAIGTIVVSVVISCLSEDK